MADRTPASLWLALHFFRLPLDIAGPLAGPALVVEQRRVLCANAAAEALGVLAGMRLAGALGMAPELQVLARRPAQEAAALEALACWAGSFTPEVCLAAADELLLEIGGCLRLFRGLEPLLAAIEAGLAAQGFAASLALAPTPLAAQWLARAGQGPACLQADELRSRLGALPLEVIGFSPREYKTLAALGVSRLDGLLRLPAAGLARRFTPQLPLLLAQALGEAPDLRARFVFPERFAQRLELPAKVELAAMLVFAARRLLASLAGWLAQRAAGVTECDLWLQHEEAEPTRLVLGFAGATRDLQRMERVLRERLEHHVLCEPVSELRLVANAPQALPGHSLGLFAQAATQALDPVIERLRARLGKEAVHGLAIQPDYRPECATRLLREGEAADTQIRPGPPRPLYLLPRPQILHERDGVLRYGGVLQRVAGPERVESGWWDEGEPQASETAPGDMTRDYYVALSEAGEWLWIFRDEAGWWLHGFFA